MSKGRLEAFSDGVIAILITIMVLELKVPHGTDWEALRPLIPIVLTYVLSFVYSRNLLEQPSPSAPGGHRINGRILWANLHLLFWLSLVPFVTGWMGENHFAPLPTAVYGAVMLLSGVAFVILTRTIVLEEGPESKLALAVGRDVKGNLSIALYAAAIPLAFVNQWIADAIYVLVALMWLVPDRRIEARLHD